MSREESRKKWKDKNPGYSKKYRESQAGIASKKKFVENHPNYFNERAMKFYRENKETINDRKRKNPKTLYATIKRNAHNRNIEISITKDEFIDWWDKQEQICVYCSVPVSRLAYTDISRKLSQRLSIDRKDNDIGYCSGNLVLACLRCNFIKSNLFTFDEMKEIGDKYIKPKWQS